MFEKKAKERAKDYTDNAKRQVAYECGFLDGVDLGYNKANEWHYTKDELPKVNTWVIGFYYGKDNWHKIFYRADGQLCQPPYAWKEIVLPELKESE